MAHVMPHDARNLFSNMYKGAKLRTDYQNSLGYRESGNENVFYLYDED